MKTFRKITLLVFCLLLFCSCSHAAGKRPEPGLDDDGQMKVVRAASGAGIPGLLSGAVAGETDFFETGIGEAINIVNMRQAVSPDDEAAVAIAAFTVIDLDGDSVKEVVLWLAVNGNEYGCEILHCQNEKIYGYLLPYRAFNSLKEDGTFHFSSGAADQGTGKIRFDEQEYWVDRIAFSESMPGPDGQLAVSFIIDGRESSQGTFKEKMERQDEKCDAARYDFTEENLEKYLC